MAECIEHIVLYIYCLPFWAVAMFAVWATYFFQILIRRSAGQRWLYPGLTAVLTLWFFAILQITVFSRSRGSYAVCWIPLHTYWTVLHGGRPELLRSAFMNMLLFFPAGLLLAAIKPPRQRAHQWFFPVLIGLGFISLGIELGQYFGQLGNAEIDDILHNTLGTAAGFWLFQIDWEEILSFP